MKIKGWDDVDAALSSIANLQAEIAEHKGAIDHLREAIGELEPRIEAFVREHEDELQERSKSLTHGRVWLRQATRLASKSWAKVLTKLLGGPYEQYVRAKYEPDKERLGEMEDWELKDLGVVRKTDDVFGYEATG
jgi:phage host-nuclease inhibitor protein Gam